MSDDEIKSVINIINGLEKLEQENKELKEQLQIKDDGFKAVNEELCEYAEENEKLKAELLLYRGGIMTDERILEIIETKDKHYILGFITGIRENAKELAKREYEENEKLKVELKLYKGGLKREHEAIHRLNELEDQQKKFVKYLEEPIKIITDGNPTNISEYTMGKLDALKEILSKYKEIINYE